MSTGVRFERDFELSLLYLRDESLIFALRNDFDCLDVTKVMTAWEKYFRWDLPGD